MSDVKFFAVELICYMDIYSWTLSTKLAMNCFKMLILEKESCPVSKLLFLCSQILSLLQNFVFMQVLSSSQPRNGPLGILGSNLSVEQQKLLNKLAAVLKAQRCTEFNSRGMESC